MPSNRPLKVELVTHPGKEEALKGVISLLFVGAVIGAQWWAVTPQAERIVKLRKLGVTKCRVGGWHFHGVPVQWPPGRCLCSWPETRDPELQRSADEAEGSWGKKE